jgi:hypothetical protein
MTLSTRPEPYIIPSYSLTGDLLSFLNCGRQYRYHNRGALPPSKPVQLWFGQFIHGVMEEAYRRWSDQRDAMIAGGGVGPLLACPWDDTTLEALEDDIIDRLAAQGLIYRNRAMLDLSRRRAREMINIIGRHLFLLIDQAEVRLQGIRDMPALGGAVPRSNYYEVSGVVDVLTSLQLAAVDPNNLLLRALLDSSDVRQMVAAARAADPRSRGEFEIIVDYKGMRRPSNDPADNTLQKYEWQLQTYSWLRDQQPSARPVLAGILLFVNELVPSRTDMEALWQEVHGAAMPKTDVLPGGADASALAGWSPTRRGAPLPTFSLGYRLRRAMHIVPMSPTVRDRSLSEFDRVVAEIEASVSREKAGARISMSWSATPKTENCTVCDFKNFCDKSGMQGAPYAP